MTFHKFNNLSCLQVITVNTSIKLVVPHKGLMYIIKWNACFLHTVVPWTQINLLLVFNVRSTRKL